MSREIKFRAWDKKYKQFKEESNIFINQLGTLYSDETGQFYSSDDYEISFFSGLKDKNGNPIYEGDIVRIKAEPPFTFDYCREVKFHEGMFGIRSQKQNVHEKITLLYLCEIIGNIHEHPELLKKKGGG